MLNRASSFRAVALASAVVVCTLLAIDAAIAGVTPLPTNAQGQAMGDRMSNPSLSHDGRYMAFQSADDGLVPEDRNGVSDVFVYDLETSKLVRASGAFLDTFGAGASVHPSISSGGRFVAFASDAKALNLPIGFTQTQNIVDDNDARDVYLYDRIDDELTALSVWSDGRLLDADSDYPSVSGDGRFVVFQSRASTPTERGGPGGPWRIFLRDRVAGQTRLISVDSDGRAMGQDSLRPVISADGRFVAFESAARLVRGDTNGRRDIYRYDIETGKAELVSVASSGDRGDADSRGASISADGSVIAFESGARNLVDGDTNLVPDVFARDFNAGTTVRVSVGVGGEQSDGSSIHAAISADGMAVVFESTALNISIPTTPRNPEGAGPGGPPSSVYLHDLVGGRTVMLAEDRQRSAQSRAGAPAISGDGGTLVFNELRLFEQPGAPEGEASEGTLLLVGTCPVPPEMAVTGIFGCIPDQVAIPITPTPSNISLSLFPGDDIIIRLDASDFGFSCDAENMRIVLLEPAPGMPLPAGMTIFTDPGVFDCMLPQDGDPLVSGVVHSTV